MGPVATVVLAGCLGGLRWLLWIVAALLVVLVIVQRVRGDTSENAMQNSLLAAVFGLGGWLSGYVAVRIIAAARRTP